MRGLSERGDGNFYFVEDAGAVTEVFTDEISFFTVPVAFDMEMTVTMGAQYEIVEAHGSSQWESTATGGHLAQPSVFLAHRVSHADVTSSGGRRGGGSALMLELQPSSSADRGITSVDIATVNVRFREPGTNRIVEDNVVIHYPNSPWIVPPTGYFQASDPTIIQKSFLMLALYEAMESACTLYHQGDRNGAVGTVRRAMAAARDYNDSANNGAGDVDVALDLQLMQELIDVFLRNGATEPVALRIPHDPWPADRDL